MSLTRRSMLLAGAAAGFAPMARGFAQDPTDGDGFVMSDEALEALMSAEADPAFDPDMAEGITRAMVESEFEIFRGGRNDWNWWRFPQDRRAEPVWPADDIAVDTAHLAGFRPSDGEAFTVHAGHLSWLAARNEFVFDPNSPLTLIGLRGLVLTDERDDSGWSFAHSVREIAPDHINFHCLMGVWNRATGGVRLFKASTVPEVAYMLRQVRLERGCNLLPSGLYGYVIGPHRASSAHAQVGAFRMVGGWFVERGSMPSQVAVLRTLNDLSYDPTAATELWDTCQPFDNIHAAVFAENGLRSGDGRKFSSAGCQVVKGDYELNSARGFTERPRGPWAAFRAAAGLTAPPQMLSGKSTADDGRRFHYMLLSGREAWLAAIGDLVFQRRYRPVRFGSTGPRVAAVQRMVGEISDGRAGARTMEAVRLYQRDIARVVQGAAFDASEIFAAD